MEAETENEIVSSWTSKAKDILYCIVTCPCMCYTFCAIWWFCYKLERKNHVISAV